MKVKLKEMGSHSLILSSLCFQPFILGILEKRIQWIQLYVQPESVSELHFNLLKFHGLALCIDHHMVVNHICPMCELAQEL